MRKLKCVLVDDDPLLLQIMKDLCESSPLAEITHSFINPKDFLNSIPHIDFDLCLLDIYMPEIEGLVLAQLLEGKPIIFVTGTDNKLKEALDLAPIDIITKPVRKERLDKALAKAYSLIYEKREYALFNIAENKGKVKLKISDMYYIQSDEADPRNKKVMMKDGTRCTLMGYTFDDLLEISPKLIQVNKSEIVSLDAVEGVNHQVITLKIQSGNKLKEISLSTSYKKKFLSRMDVIK